MRRRDEPRLPGKPVGDLLCMIAEREGVTLDVIADRAGMTERTCYWLAKGGRDTITFGFADIVLTNLCMLWWHVWNERTVRLPLLTVEIRHPRSKLSRAGVRVRYWDQGRKRYGDAGPDHDALAAIERIFWGEREEAA